MFRDSTYHDAWESLRGRPGFRIASTAQIFVAALIGRGLGGGFELAANFYSLGRRGWGRLAGLAGVVLAASEGLAVWRVFQFLLAEKSASDAIPPLRHPLLWACALWPLAAAALAAMAAQFLIGGILRTHRGRGGAHRAWLGVIARAAAWGALWGAAVFAVLYFH